MLGGKVEKKGQLEGKVLSTKMQKSFVIAIERMVKHPLYGKYLRRTTKLHVHDEHEEAKEGDLVTVKPCRPISKTKAWTLVQITRRASVL